jgi:glycosyltransferase involved in cell wall biosynthesis
VIDISVLIPCLNEAENVDAIVDAVAAELRRADVSYEIIFIDNGSTDGTIDLIKRICAKDERVRLIVNNKNFGQMRSPTYGIYQTSGRAVIGISADFQDPTNLIGEFIARWRAGTHIVLGVRHTERMSLTMRIVRAIGYGFFERFGDYRVIPGATGFGLYDRQVVDCLKQWRDPEPFFRGMLVESGYSLETIPYHRPGRAAGLSKNNFGTMMSFALSSLASCSKKLLRIPLFLSLLAFPLGLVTLLAAFVLPLFGFTSWNVLFAGVTLCCFALIFLFLGLLGEQVRLIAEMTRNVPLVTEKERVNFPPSQQ